MSTLKTVGLVLLAFVVFVATIVVMLAYGLFSMGTEVVEQANMPVVQTVTMAGDRPVITVPLQPGYGLVFDGLAPICRPDDKRDDAFFDSVSVEDDVDGSSSSSYVCVDGACKVVIGIGDREHPPTAVYAYLEDATGACRQRRLPETEPQVSGYSAVVEITPALKARLGIGAEPYKVRSVHSHGVMSWQIMGTRKVELQYGQALASDSLTIDGKPVATLRFSENPAL